MTATKPATRQLVRHLESRANLVDEPCYILRHVQRAALIIPTLHGAYHFARGFYRYTVDQAVTDGIVTLGPDLVDVPQNGGGGPLWTWDGGGLMGRTIALAGGAK